MKLFGDVMTLDPTKQCKYDNANFFNSMKSSYGRERDFFLFFATFENETSHTKQPTNNSDLKPFFQEFETKQ
jgi:hypothetical protein